MRKKFQTEYDKTGYDEPNLMGIVAATSAYSQGEEWFNEAKNYIYENILFACDFIQKNCPKIRVIKPEGSYLLWLDFGGFDLSDSEINERILNKAKVWLDSGKMFGREGEKFQRINCAAPRAILEEALKRIALEFES